jgi:hypothetical protein
LQEQLKHARSSTKISMERTHLVEFSNLHPPTVQLKRTKTVAEGVFFVRLPVLSANK